MNESSYLTLLGKLEHSDSWGFGDAFELLCFHTRVFANAFDSGRENFIKIDKFLNIFFSQRAFKLIHIQFPQL